MNSLNNIRLSMLDLVAVRQGTARSARPAAFAGQCPPRRGPGFHPLLAGRTPTCRASPVRRPPCWSAHIAGGTQRIRSVPAASCCPTTRRWWWPKLRHAGRAVSRPYRSRLGRAPGTDAVTMRRPCVATASRQRPIFPREVAELQRLLGLQQPGQLVVAVPGRGRKCRSGCSAPACSRPAGGRARLALCLRLAFRAGHAAPGHRHLSPQFPAIRPPLLSLCRHRCTADCGGDRRRSGNSWRAAPSSACSAFCAVIGLPAATGRRFL